MQVWLVIKQTLDHAEAVALLQQDCELCAGTASLSFDQKTNTVSMRFERTNNALLRMPPRAMNASRGAGRRLSLGIGR